MELKEAIQKNNQLTEAEKEIWAERCEELKAEGMSDEDALRQIIAEMREDVDSDLAQLKKGLGKK